MTQPHTLDIQDLQKAPFFIRIHHVGIAVPDLETAIPAYEALFGQSVQRIEEVLDQQELHFSPSAKATSNSSRTLQKPRRSHDTLLRTAQAFIIYVLRVKDVASRFWHTTVEQGVQLIDERPRKAHNMMLAFLSIRDLLAVCS